MTQPTRSGNLITGLAAAVGVAVLTTIVWVIIGNAFDGRQISYGAIAVGAAIGFVAGRIGGADPVLAVAAGVLGAASVFVGDLFIVAHVGAKQLGVSSFTLIKDDWSEVWAAYKIFADFISVLFYGLAGFFGFRVTMSVGHQHHGRPAAPPAPAWQPPTGAPAGEPTSPPPAAEGVPDMYKKDVPPTA